MVKFLIIRFSSIGDIVLTTPVIRGLKQQVEDAEIHFLTKKKYESVLVNNPYIDKLHLFDNNFGQTLESLQNEQFDHIIDLHKNLRTRRFITRLQTPALSFKKLNLEKWIYVNFKRNILPDVHLVDRYMDTVAPFDVENDGQGLDYFIAMSDEVNLLDLPGKLPYGYIGFSIGGQHYTKRMPPEKIARICDYIERPVLLLGGPDDRTAGDMIVSLSRNEVHNGTGIYTLNQSASLIRQARLVITHDTGLMHIAAAFRKPIISLWGNTVPEFGMYPYMPDNKSVIVENKNLRCRPCSKIGFSRCPRKHFRCMNELNEYNIAELANLLLMPAFKDKIRDIKPW